MHWELKKLLYDKGISQRDLARAVGVSEVMISNVVNGKRKLSRRLSEAISTYLGISEKQLSALMVEKAK